MIFMCCHPEISREASVALSLKTVGGFSVREIARAFLADDAAIAQRLVRAKRQIRERGLTLEMPHGVELNRRLDSVLEVIYFIFNEGYTAHEGQDLIRQDLCAEALRLGESGCFFLDRRAARACAGRIDGSSGRASVCPSGCGRRPGLTRIAGPQPLGPATDRAGLSPLRFVHDRRRMSLNITCRLPSPPHTHAQVMPSPSNGP